jgi:membrane-associated phospholipid phosphatase
MESHYHPDYAWLWYTGASAIAYSRVDLNRHRPTEVLAGAAIGYLTARLELSQKHGLLLFPIIDRDKEGTKIGLQIFKSF